MKEPEERIEQTVQAEAAAKTLETKSMSLLETARNSLVGIPSDLVSGRGTLQEIFTKENRLRGLGIILVLIAVFVAVSGLIR